jgi:hypothetical protein
LITTLLLALLSPVFAQETIADSAAAPQITNVAYYFYNTVRCARAA